MSSAAQLSTVYCTDEDIAVRCYADFSALAPKDQILAQGNDGAFDPSDPWTLSSASNDFQAQGIQVGHVLQIKSSPISSGGSSKFAVGAVDGHSVTLRRCGKGDGLGLPPGPAGGATGISFVVQTFDPQIEDVSFQINQRYGIEPDWPPASPDQIADLRVLRQATALEVIVRAYAGDTRSKGGDFALKLYDFRQQHSAALGIVQVRWAKATNTPPPTSLFSTSIGR